MSAGKVATAIDKITPKTPSGLRVVFSKPAGNETSLALVDINDWDYVTKEMLGFNTPNTPIIYNLPANSETPVIINFTDSTIKIGSASPVAIGSDLTAFQGNQDNIIYKKVDAVDDTITTPYENVTVSAEQWSDNTYTSLVSVTIQPDTDTGLPGGLTLDNINIIIKP